MATLHQMIAEMRQAQAAFRPVYREYQARKRANMCQDGPTGFIMVFPAPPPQEDAE